VKDVEFENIIISAGITILALGMFLVSIYSYRRFKMSKLLLVSGAFFIFFIKGLLLSADLFTNLFTGFTSSIYFHLFDVLILILLFSATLKR
jgi:hypothetical protein